MIPATPIRAATVLASDTGVPKQIYSVTDNKTNIYVFDLGFIRDTYVGTTAGPATYSIENSSPILQATKYEETTISETLSESVADCIEVSTTDETTHETGGSTGTETEYTDWYEGWGIQILSCGFTLPKSFNDVITESSSTSWSDSVTKVVTNSVSRTRSVETSFSKIETKGWTNGVSYPVDKNAPKGQRYRVALYVTTDVYLVIKTSRNNRELLDHKLVICVRDGTDDYNSVLEHTPVGEDFDNSPIDEKIEIAAGFYRNLTPPVYDPDNIIPSRRLAPLLRAVALPSRLMSGEESNPIPIKVLKDETLEYVLIGGGAGGSGGVASRDYDLFQTTRAFAGRSAAGGHTVLKLNNELVASARGGSGVDGPDSGEVNGNKWSSNGRKGNNGRTKDGIVSVHAGDVLTIEVGYGGGGSGGATANDTGGTISSDSADRTLGSEGKATQEAGTYANASRGGVGGMHSLVFPDSQFTSDMQKGKSSPAAGRASAAAGGFVLNGSNGGILLEY